MAINEPGVYFRTRRLENLDFENPEMILEHFEG